MTDPLDEWYRAAIAETMRPCRELSRESKVRIPPEGRKFCPSCGADYAASYLSAHIRTRHPKAVDSVGGNVDRGAA